ncbi:hypothetical protein ABZV67_39950 [Streptomyces sp. NPDC005065]|uniref:hypothetical protein n=1 Tax=Streptomyces sp. NPDC005065 TaxID=3154461 RepID=UPI0033A0E717
MSVRISQWSMAALALRNADRIERQLTDLHRPARIALIPEASCGPTAHRAGDSVGTSPAALALPHDEGGGVPVPSLTETDICLFRRIDTQLR